MSLKDKFAVGEIVTVRQDIGPFPNPTHERTGIVHGEDGLDCPTKRDLRGERVEIVSPEKALWPNKLIVKTLDGEPAEFLIPKDICTPSAE